ncbi:hypothetical protein WR25_06077 [Diploscapter pachys]|uniref:Galactosylgalactosylxylosylprotein 3-beta-glucuronosyltransferase n=1 Tax=Diploscapter pachys TaxID=2018661 RepID=A0A2A2LNP7_9BILA|nr:hypothetical protein WR25_06077 [Diploscapter pachys]
MRFVLRNVRRHLMKTMFATLFCVVTITLMQFTKQSQLITDITSYSSTPPANYENRKLIIVITPTYRRPTRMADMTRMGNTLSHVKDLHWVVIEDGQAVVPQVERLLQRTGLNYTYLNAKTADGYPKRGWYQRTVALRFVRAHAKEMLGNLTKGVVYFGDDDNSYDVRLFTEYIRNVKKLGMWAVALVGGTAIESQNVVNGSVASYKVKWNPRRQFAVDMAGFAISLDVVLNTTAVFGKTCPRGLGAPETCLLEDMGLKKEDIEPFGYDKPSDREVYVWHTKSQQPKFDKAKVDVNGFFAENDRDVLVWHTKTLAPDLTRDRIGGYNSNKTLSDTNHFFAEVPTSDNQNSYPEPQQQQQNKVSVKKPVAAHSSRTFGSKNKANNKPFPFSKSRDTHSG